LGRSSFSYLLKEKYKGMIDGKQSEQLPSSSEGRDEKSELAKSA